MKKNENLFFLIILIGVMLFLAFNYQSAIVPKETEELVEEQPEELPVAEEEPIVEEEPVEEPVGETEAEEELEPVVEVPLEEVPVEEAPVEEDQNIFYVNITPRGFYPVVIDVEDGTTIVWTNHDKNLQRRVKIEEIAKWDSGVIPYGESWNTTLPGPKVYNYVDELHPSKKGRIRVAAPRGGWPMSMST